MSHEDGLCDAIACVHGVGCVGGIEEQDHHFAAIVRVDGSRGIEDGDAVFEGESASWTNFDMEALGD